MREEAVVDVLLVAVAGGAGEGLFRLDPSEEEVAALLVGQYVGAGRGGVVDLLRLLLGVVELGEAAASYALTGAAFGWFELEVEGPGAVALAQLGARRADGADLGVAVGVEDRIALLVLEWSLALASPVVARLEHPVPCCRLLIGSQPAFGVVRIRTCLA